MAAVGAPAVDTPVAAEEVAVKDGVAESVELPILTVSLYLIYNLTTFKIKAYRMHELPWS